MEDYLGSIGSCMCMRSVFGSIIIMSICFSLLVFTALTSGCLEENGISPENPPDESIRDVNAYEAQFLIEKFENNADFIILDIRRPDELSGGFISGAVILSYQSPGFTESVVTLDRNSKYLVYTTESIQSENVKQVFTFLEFKEIYYLEGGLTAWKNAGFNVLYPGDTGNITFFSVPEVTPRPR